MLFFSPVVIAACVFHIPLVVLKPTWILVGTKDVAQLSVRLPSGYSVPPFGCAVNWGPSSCTSMPTLSR